MKDATSRLRTATRRAKSDVANKLVSMFLHELSRRISRDWPVRVDSDEYASAVRQWFENRCPYCIRELALTDSVVEHLDGLNRYRAGLHVPGNVLVACRRCNSEKRRDDSARTLSLAESGWASFLSHDGSRCGGSCPTCSYWRGIWQDEVQRKSQLDSNRRKIVLFRSSFVEFEQALPHLKGTLPELLTTLYSDCQRFAETEIKLLLEATLPRGLASEQIRLSGRSGTH